MSYVDKDPNARRLYALDWSKEIGTDPIAASTWTLPSGITQGVPSPSFDGTRTRIWLEGGTDGTVYRLLNRITTENGETLDKTLRVWVKDA